MGMSVIVVKDMELIKSILVKDFDYFIDRRTMGGEDKNLRKSVIFMKGQAWRNMRAALTPTFSSGKIRQMFEQFDASGKKLVDYVKIQCPKAQTTGYEVTLDDILRRYTVDVIGSVAFGMDTKALKEQNSDFLKYATKASKISKLAGLMRMRMVDAEASNFLVSILLAAVKMRETSGEKRNDFLQLLLKARKDFRSGKTMPKSEEMNVEFTDEVLISQGFTFFLAGFDTMTNMLRNMMYLMSAHPEVQDKLRAEIKEKTKSSPGMVTYDSVNQMEYMDMVVSETLRLCPPGTRLERKCVRDYEIPGEKVIIPKDTVVVIPVIGIHNDEKYYPNPGEFNPENFSTEQKASRSQYTFMSFGQGPRNCIGMRFALMEAKAAAAHILMKFKIQPSDKYPLPLKWEKFLGVNMAPKDSVVRFVPLT